MTADRVAFLRARLDEDERAARAANEANTAPWRADLYSYRDGEAVAGMVVGETMPDRKHLEGGLWDNEGAASLSMEVPTAQHVARHDPVRVLAEVAAKRAILDRWTALQDRIDVEPDAGKRDRLALTRHGLDFAVHVLAQPHTGHPHFHPSWSTG